MVQPGSRAFLRKERLLHDKWVKLVNGLRRYEVVPDGTLDRFAVAETVTAVEHAQFLIRHGDIRKAAGPFYTKPIYVATSPIVPARLALICEGCGATVNKRDWELRQHMLSDTKNHRCPEVVWPDPAAVKAGDAQRSPHSYLD